jgi:hypothetical protein
MSLVEFIEADLVEKYRHRTGVEIVDDRRIVSRAGDWWSAWRQFFF